MKLVIHHLSIISAAILLLTSCQVEFSPNAKWQEIPVVYCLLDQDDDTSWVRVERCFLGEGNVYSYGSISDSINYQPGQIQISILAYQNGIVKDSIPFNYTVRDHYDGPFADQNQPVYFAETSGRLKETYDYFVLNVRRADGSLLCSGRTELIRQTSNTLFRHPSNYERFGFFQAGPSALIEWDALQNGRRYQPIVRFYYAEHGDTLHLDMPCAILVASNQASTLHNLYSQDAFLTTLYEALKDDPEPKTYLKYVDIYLSVANEDFNAYIQTVGHGSSIDQDRQYYSNIDGGIGVFASRRTHLYKTSPADSSLVAGRGLYALIKDLNIGFE